MDIKSSSTNSTNIVHNKRISKLKALKKYLNDRYSFYYDEIGNVIDFAKSNEEYNKRSPVHLETLLEEVRENVFYNTSQGKSSSYGKDYLADLLASRNFSIPFNPIKKYLEGISDNSSVDFFDKLASLLVLEDRSPEEFSFVKNAFKKWFVGAVKSVYEPEYVPKQMLVLRSTTENIGKSSLLNSFLPSCLRKYSSFCPSLKNQSKDTVQSLVNSFIIYFDEIDLFLETKENRLGFKAFASQPFVNVRPAFSRGREYRSRIASFLGTCNGLEFTSKTAGKSRFVVVNVENIWNKKAQKKAEIYNQTPAENFNIDGLWAQAYKLYKEGYNPIYDDVEMEEVFRRNELHMFTCEVTELVTTHLSKSSKNDEKSEFITTSEMRQYLNSKDENLTISSVIKLGKVLNELGFSKRPLKKGGKTIYGYYVKKVNQSQLDTQEDEWLYTYKK